MKNLKLLTIKLSSFVITGKDTGMLLLRRNEIIRSLGPPTTLSSYCTNQASTSSHSHSHNKSQQTDTEKKDNETITMQKSLYAKWEQNGFYNPPSEEKGRQFRMVMPPPNVTGDLHMGHAVTIFIQDTLARWKRMNGYSVKWIPGFDHAGIATQIVMEKKIKKEKGLRRTDMSRQEFVNLCQEWKEQRVKNISNQLRLLGASVNWDLQYYTMDEKFSSGVRKAFVEMYERGLIFRKSLPVHWCPFLQSTISQREVDMMNVDEPPLCHKIPSRKDPVELGWMYTIGYPLSTDPSQIIWVSTTRPETMIGDVAVAVNPNHAEYSQFIGQSVQHPIIPNLSIPILSDESVLIDLGTGALKITPAHDFTDYDLGVKHGLPLNKTVINDRGRMECSDCMELNGQDRFTARETIIQLLKDRKLFKDKQAHKMSVPICSRSGDIIEPLVKDQWFMKTDFSDTEAEEIKLIPQSSHQLELWCLSRQLWWGHRIPAWQPVEKKDDPWIVSETEAQAAAKVSSDSRLIEEEDVFDTWFSSSLVPYITSAEAPIDVLVSGHDILGLWVSRMVLMSKSLTGKRPFLTVLAHGIVSDAEGRKMSKSVGNVLDPIDLISGTHDGCGADWLRLALFSTDLRSKRIKFDAANQLKYKTLVFKLRNGLKYFNDFYWTRSDYSNKEGMDVQPFAIDQRRMLVKLARAVDASNKSYSHLLLRFYFLPFDDVWFVDHLCGSA